MGGGGGKGEGELYLGGGGLGTEKGVDLKGKPVGPYEKKSSKGGVIAFKA